MGIKSGFSRNEGVPGSMMQKRLWKYCELSEDEFMRLEIPDGTHTLIKDKKEENFDSGLKKDVKERLREIKRKKKIEPLVLREPIPGDAPSLSFFIEDGAHRAIAYSVYTKKHQYVPVKCYVGFYK